MIKIPFAILANESFNAIPMASARVDKETIKPEVDNSSIAAHAKTKMTRQMILIIEAIKDTIAPSIRVLSKIFFNKKQTNHVMQMPTITMQTQSNILSPY